MFNKYMLGAAAVAMMAASAPAVYAQQTTAAIRGVVTDAKGAPVADATVTIIHLPSGTRVVARTAADGRYDVSGLKVGGPYEIDIAAAGQKDSQTTDVYLTLGDQQKLDVAMEEVGATTVVVTGKRTTILSNPGSRTRMGRAELAEVVTYKRDIREAARRDPLTNLDPNTRGTGPSGGLYIAGSAPRANRITIDGVRSNDDFGLNTGGLSTNLGPISIEAIEQMTVQAVPADVEEGDFTGGSLNLVLRSGNNSFHGSLFDNFRNKAWNGSQLYHPDTGVSNKLKLYVPDENYGFFLSGPILKDKLFFATSYEKYTSASVVAAGPSGGGFGTSLGYTDNTTTPSTFVPINQSYIDSIVAPWNTYAASASLKPGSIPLTTPFKDEKYSVKLDWNVMEGQRVSFTYRHAFSNTWKGAPASSSALFLNTNWYTQPENEDNYALQLNSRWNDNFSTEARITMRNYQRGQMPPEGQGFSGIQVCTDATSLASVSSCTTGKLTLNFGPDQFRQANVLKTTNNSGEFVGTYRLGGHSIKAGYQGKQIGIYNLFVQAANGLYYFDSQKSFSDGKVDQLFYNNNPSGDANKAAADFSYMNNTLFVQDTFDPIENLTVNYGLRYDFWNMDDKPALNPNFTARNGYSNQVTYDGLSVLQPRIGAKWHNEEGTLDASASFGLYTGGLPDVFLSNRFGNTGILTATFTLQRQADGTFKETNSGTVFAANDPTVSALMNIDKTDAKFAQGVPSSATSLLSLNPGLVRVANTNSIAPGFEMPSDWKLNLSTHYHTPIGVVLGLDAVFVRSHTGLAFRDVRARPLTINGVQQYTPDGRMRYDGLSVAATTGTTLDTRNASIFVNRTALGLDTAKNADGSSDLDLANPGSGYDIQAYNPSQESSSRTIAFSATKSFDSLHLFRVPDHLDLSAAYTNQKTNQYGGVPEFATTDCCGGSNYGDQISLEDPNAPTLGKSSYEIYHGYKFNATYEVEFFRGAKTNITLFGDLHDGRPLSFYVADAGSAARGQVFGVVSNNQLAFIPQMTTPMSGNALGFMTGNVPVYFKTSADLANLKTIVDKFGLPTGILSKGSNRNPDVKRWDLHLSQELPIPMLEGHKLTATLDIFNLSNLLNKKWGVVAEYGSDGRQGTPIYKVACTDATGTVVSSASAVCAGYQISSVSTTMTTPTVNQTATLYSVMAGLKYSF
ncbi:TonB-dependent receptor [Asticcacaulis sp. 201]|uniref:TonB-dependent receptor n=1 Tax=Asticcacaulis sp. 201 TaxID=3028787 RepID=UPI002916F2A2|nr:TonB-dependent receptor [Asticcacaulis sp. 201]MDV6330409.1 TonB-dependent receptor [Asticcacaulis sp. 201]